MAEDFRKGFIERIMRAISMRPSPVVRIEVAKATLNVWKSDSWCGCQACQNSLPGKVDAGLGHELH